MTKRRTAADLIAEKENQGTVLPGDALELVRGVLAHNDKLPDRDNRRVSMERVLKALREDYGLGIGRVGLERALQVQLGRGWRA